MAAANSAHVCTPVDAALQALLSACKADALASTAIPPGAVTLSPPPCTTARYDGDLIVIGTDPFQEDRWIRRRECPPNWGGPGQVQWHPAHWRGTIYRIDGEGRQWSCCAVAHVVDDFGSLVPVEQH